MLFLWYPLYIVGYNQDVLDKAMFYIESYMTVKLYAVLFCPSTTDDEQKDLHIQNHIRSLHWVTPSQIDTPINEHDQNVRKLVDQAITGNIHSLTGFGKNQVYCL